MKAVILNGELDATGILDPVATILEDEIRAFPGEVESIRLSERDIKTCIGCFRCWSTTPGECFQKDDAPEIVRKAIQSDLLVFLTPLTFGGYSSELKKMIERMLGLLQPGMQIHHGETHHIPRYDRYPSLLAIAYAKNPEKEEMEIFQKLGERHSLNFYPPFHDTEVFFSDTPGERIREKIGEFLQKMEAGQ
ncbi:flavodoxin family protein [Acidobacteriota bacterium]